MAESVDDRSHRWWSRSLLALFFALPLAFALLTSRGLYYRDHVLFFRPTWWSIYTQLRRFELPIMNLWHPAGLPHEASTNFALLTPNTALLLLGPFERSYDLFVLSHFAVLGSGTFVLARLLGGSRVASMGAASLVALSGPVISFENLVVGLQGLAYTPWLLAGLVLCRRSPGAFSVGFLGLGFGFAAQGIMPELFLLDAIGAAWILGGPRFGRLGAPAIASMGLGVLLGLGLASADLVPLFEAMRGTARGMGFDTSMREAWSIEPLQLLELLIPSVWSLSELTGIAISAATGVQEAPYFTSLYLGVGLPLSLAAVSPKRRGSVVLLALAVLFLLVAMGPTTPLHRWLSSLPLLRSSRYPVKYSLCALPFLAVLLGLGIRDLSARRSAMRALALAHFLVLLASCATFYSSAFEAWVAATARPYTSKLVFEYFRDGDPVQMALTAIRARVWPALGFSAVLVALLATPRLRGSPWLGPALVTTLMFDLLVGAHFAIMTAPVSAERMPPALESAVPGLGTRVFPGAVPPVPTRPGQTPFESAVHARGSLGHLAWAQFRALASIELEGLGSNRVQRLYQGALEGLRPDELHALLRRAGVSRMITTVDLAWPRLAEASDVGGRRISVYEISSARPRVSAFPSWIQLSSSSTQALSWLTAPPAAKSALLWDVPEAVPAESSEGCIPSARATSVRSAEVIELEVRTSCRALVVVQEVHRSRWEVEVDGAETEVLNAEAGYLAAFVPPGEHRVRFRYASLFRAWLPLSMVSFVLSVGMVLAGLVRRRRSNERISSPSQTSPAASDRPVPSFSKGGS